MNLRSRRAEGRVAPVAVAAVAMAIVLLGTMVGLAPSQANTSNGIAAPSQTTPNNSIAAPSAPQNRQATGALAVNPRSDWVVMTTDGHYIYAATSSGEVQKIDPSTGQALITSRLISGRGIDGIYTDGKFLYVGTTAPAIPYRLYKLDLDLRPLYNVTDVRDGVASVVVLKPGGNVYFGDGGGFLYEYDPSLSNLTAESRLYPHAGFAYSISDARVRGPDIWWMNRIGDVVVTDASLRTIAGGSIPANTSSAGGFVSQGGAIFTGDGLGRLLRLDTAGANLTWSPALTLPAGYSASFESSPIIFGGHLYIPLKTTPAAVLDYTYPGLSLAGSFRPPDGGALGLNVRSIQFGSEMVVLRGQVFVLTNSTIYAIGNGH